MNFIDNGSLAWTMVRGGGKTQTSTGSVSIPPEVLSRYNAVNAQAQTVAQTPFQQYSTDPNAFVAPLDATQNAGILGTNEYSSQAQPYYQTGSNDIAAGYGTAGLGAGAIGSGFGTAQAGYGDIAGGYNTAGQGYAGIGTGLGTAEAGSGGITAGLGQMGNAASLVNQGSGAANAQQLTPGYIGQFENPYAQNVIAPTAALMEQQFNQAQSGQLGNAINNGAFGGDRAAITAANLQQQQGLAFGNTIGGLEGQMYNTALGAAQQQQGVNLGAQQANLARLQQAGTNLAGIGTAQGNLGSQYGQLGATEAGIGSQFGQLGATEAGIGSQFGTLGGTEAGIGAQYGNLGTAQAGIGTAEGNLGAGAQAAGLSGAQAQMAAGQAQQQTEQAGLTALYNQFLQQQSYPFQTTQFLGNLAEGTGALSGSNTSATSPAPFFSDERLKTDIEPIGKTFDGQKIIRFRYKDEPHKRIGLIAQDVERKHPDAVGLAGGYKTVDYDAATSDAAAAGRTRKASGGGLVPFALERRAYAYGGLSPNSAWDAGFYVDPSYLSAQEQGYASAPWGNSGPVAGSAPYGGRSHVPPSTGSGAHGALAVAKLPPPSNSNTLKQVSQGLGDVEKLGTQGKSLYQGAQGVMGGLSPSSPAAAPAATQTAPAAAMGGDAMASAAIPTSDTMALAGAGTDSQAELGDAIMGAFAKRGGLMLDGGGFVDASTDDQSAGGDIPYDSGTGQGGMDIPDDRNTRSLQVAQPLSNSGSNSGLGNVASDAGDALKLATMIIPFLNRGGLVPRKHRADGGPSDDPDVNDLLGGRQIAVNARETAPTSGGLVPPPAPPPVQVAQANNQPEASGQHGYWEPQGQETQPNSGGLSGAVNGIRNTIGQNQDLIMPLLHGLGTMASSNSRYLGSAVLQGLGGAADSYENVQNEMMNRGLTGAATGVSEANAGLVGAEKQRVQAGTTGMNIENAQKAWTQTPFGWVVWEPDGMGGAKPVLAKDHNPNNPTVAAPPDAPQRAAQALASASRAPIAGTPAAAGPLPQMAPGVGYDSISRKVAQQEPNVAFTGNAANAIDRTNKYRDAVTANATEARQDRPYYDDMAKTFVSAAHAGGPGAYGQERSAMTKTMNYLASKVGAGDGYFGDTDTNNDVLNKIATLQGSAGASAGGQHSFEALRSMANALPNMDKTPDAGYNVTAQLMVRRQQALDAESHMLAYQNDSNGSLMRAGPDFMRANPPAKYNQEANQLQDAMRHYPNAFNAMVDGQANPAQIEDFFHKKYGQAYHPGLSRYFGQ